MNNKLFVGNLSYRITDADLAELFGSYGQVVSAVTIKDRDTGRPRGFGFVEMASQAEAEAAIKGLNSRDVDGRSLAVNLSEPKPRSGSRPRGRY
ncbi:MAG TPA: RNA-binding protein [Candidatus Obscuribacterales bacterium]